MVACFRPGLLWTGMLS